MLEITDQMERVASLENAIVYFTASWCQPCKMIKPHFIKLANEDSRNYFIVDIDNDFDFNIADIETYTRLKEDPQREKYVKYLYLENNFYNVFRNTVRILLNKYLINYLVEQLIKCIFNEDIRSILIDLSEMPHLKSLIRMRRYQPFHCSFVAVFIKPSRAIRAILPVISLRTNNSTAAINSSHFKPGPLWFDSGTCLIPKVVLASYAKRHP